MYKLIQTIKEKLKDITYEETLTFKSSHKDIKSWVDISDHFYCKLISIENKKNDIVEVKLKKLNPHNSFHNDAKNNEKYCTNSLFNKIDKNQKPAFLLHYLKALENVQVDTRLRILNLGVNTGGEFEVIKQISNNLRNQYLLGIDYSNSAIEKAKELFKEPNIEFITYDINDLEQLNLEPFDLIITIGTIQSATDNFNKLFMKIVQSMLKKSGAIIMGFPNCRWIDNSMVYGANPKNYNFPEMSVLYKDVIFCKKYLQQKKFRVTITGKEYIFLTATAIK
jgi:cyclopropane fatty-acyl-phospholipid synthase-like methyltransferase